MEPYNEERFIGLIESLTTIIDNLMDMEGNDANLIRDEVYNILENREDFNG